MSFSPALADIRFGCGLSPVHASPPTAEAMLEGVTGPDEAAARYPVEDFATFSTRLVARADLDLQRKKMKDKAQKQELNDRIRALNRDTFRAQRDWAGSTFLRWAHGPSGFRERLVSFWTDHFTAVGKTVILEYGNASYVESAIRPNISGSFADLLFATTTHPVMMSYLDQLTSAGPNSPAVARNNRVHGLNENLAREVMELHTLGVDGPYTQDDVRQLAELLTGITYRPRKGLVFVRDWAEPGAETVLGHTYSEDASLDTVRDALTGLATHPATARHIARKLAVHFVSDTPDPDLVAHVEARFNATGGDLAQVYAALLEHPAAWDPALANVKPAFDFMGSAFRALAIPEEPMTTMTFPLFRTRFFAPLAFMGQPWLSPSGPNGWPEEDSAWVNPQSVSARLRWAIAIPQHVCPDLPDPRVFVDSALGPFVTEPVRFAAGAAESRSEAIGLVLCAPAFQRR